MNISQELIQRFFNKQCTTLEADEISSYLKNNPEILDNYLNKQEWDDAAARETTSSTLWSETWKNIQAHKTSKPKIHWLRKISIAASVIGLLGVVGWLLLNNQQTNHNHRSVAAFVHRNVNNTSKITKQVLLTDGSIVRLSPNSRLEYDEPFQNKKRTIYLVGAAIFNIAKDKIRPFTVYSDAISTTALGTVFSVNSFNKVRYIKVHLFEGQVVVKSINRQGKGLIKDMYLNPGDELIYNKTEMLASLYQRDKAEAVNPANNKPEVQWLSFHKTSLSSVFDQLAAKYHTHIEYSGNDMERLYFIGNFDRTDSLEHILITISQLNNLKVKGNSTSGFTITK